MLDLDKLDILYRSDDLVAINKPHGLLVHASRIARDVDVNAIQLLRDQIGQYVYPIHRIDRKTSGVLLFGMNKEIHDENFLAISVGKQTAKYFFFPISSFVLHSNRKKERIKKKKMAARTATIVCYCRLLLGKIRLFGLEIRPWGKESMLTLSSYLVTSTRLAQKE